MLSSATMNASRCRSVVCPNRCENGTASRNAKSTWTPGSATRSSLRSSISSRLTRSSCVSSATAAETSRYAAAADAEQPADLGVDLRGARDARPAEPQWLYRSGVDERLLEHFGGDAAEHSVQEWRPHEPELFEPRIEFAAQRLVTVDSEVSRLPLRADLVERGGRLPVTRRAECAPLAVEPVERRLVHQVPPDLVDDEYRARPEQRRNAVEPVCQIADRVERTHRDDGVEPALVIVEVLQANTAEEISLRRERVDAEHVVPRDRERRRQLALTAAHVEHARRRGRKVVSGELEERGG